MALSGIARGRVELSLRQITFAAVLAALAADTASAQVTSFNTRTGSVSLLPSDVVTALGYTPVNPGTATTYLAPQTFNAGFTSNGFNVLNDPSGTGFPGLVFENGGVQTWSLHANSAGANSLSLDRRVGGTYADTPVIVSNATGQLTLADGLALTSNALGATTTVGYANSTWSPYEIELGVNVAGNNVLALVNHNPNGFSAITARGPDNYNPNPTEESEHMALGWADTPTGGGDFFEFSNFDNTNDPGRPPAHFMMKQSGGIDITGGVTLLCNLTAGSSNLSCSGAAPAASSGLYVMGYNIPDDTQIASGGGTANPVMTHNALANASNQIVRFWPPSPTSIQFFSAERDEQAYFNYWDGSQAIVMYRSSAADQVGVYGGVRYSTRQILAPYTSDPGFSLHDHIIFWNSSASGGKTERIAGCSNTSPSPSGQAPAGLELIVVDEAGSAGTAPITIAPLSGQINFGSSYIINTNNGHVRLICDGHANWVVT